MAGGYTTARVDIVGSRYGSIQSTVGNSRARHGDDMNEAKAHTL